MIWSSWEVLLWLGSFLYCSIGNESQFLTFLSRQISNHSTKEFRTWSQNQSEKSHSRWLCTWKFQKHTRRTKQNVWIFTHKFISRVEFEFAKISKPILKWFMKFAIFKKRLIIRALDFSAKWENKSKCLDFHSIFTRLSNNLLVLRSNHDTKMLMYDDWSILCIVR